MRLKVPCLFTLEALCPLSEYRFPWKHARYFKNTFMDHFWLDPWPFCWLILKLLDSDSELIFDDLHKTCVEPIDCPASSSSLKSTAPSSQFSSCSVQSPGAPVNSTVSSQRKISEFRTRFSGILPILHPACLLHTDGTFLHSHPHRIRYISDSLMHCQLPLPMDPFNPT